MKGIKERNIKWHKKNLKIFQIPTEGLEFAFVSPDYEQVHQLVWCKDFMQDAVFSQIHQKSVQIYGFSYDPSISPAVSLDRTRIMVTSFKDADFGSKICNNCLEFLNQIEDHLKMSRTVVEKCSTAPPTYRKSGVWILDGSVRWIKAPPMVSLFTLLVRVGLVHRLGDSFTMTLNRIRNGKVKPYNWRAPRANGVDYENDKTFLWSGKDGLDTILSHGDRKLFHRKIEDNYPAKNKMGREFSTYMLHDSCGIVGFSQGKTKTEFPHWHRMDEK